MQIVSKTLPLSTRVQRGLKVVEESRLHKKPFWGEGLTVLDEETVKLPLVKRKALAIKKVLSEMPVNIKDYELLVGSIIQNSTRGRAPFPEYATREEKEATAKKFVGPGSIFGHIELYYPKILRLGVSGIRKITEDKLAEVKSNGTEPEKEAWYEAVLISFKGLQNLHERYRDLALTLADSEADTKRKEELQEIARICQNIIQRPPETFREALQTYWLANTAIESIGHISAYARFDQNLWPFLKRDFENGTITLEEAQELVDLQWLKHNERLQLLEAVDDPIAGDIGKTIEASIESQVKEGFPRGQRFGTKTTQGRGVSSGAQYNEFFQSVTLSGLTPEGKDATNPLTYLALNATYRLRLVKPEMYLRLHKESPPELYEWSADLIRAGLANPNIFNDEAIVPALVKEGFPVEYAREYCGDGCWEAHPQGRTHFTFGSITITELLERTLSLASWKVPATQEYTEELDPFIDVKVPDPYTYRSFDEVMETFKKLIDIYIKAWVKHEIMMRDGRKYEIAPLPLFSALVEGPLESGRDITQGGEQYQQQGIVLRGLSHTADSLAVIKKLCFEEKTVDWAELLDAIRDNWEGKESLRQLVRTRAPAYGNDIDYVDDIASGIIEFYVESIRKHAAGVDTNIIWTPGIATFGNNVQAGYLIGATPDGRLAKEPLSTNASPSVGRAVSGQTGAMNSYLKLPHTDLPIASPLDLAIQKRSGVLSQVEALMRVFVEGKGSLLTISVNDCQELRAAQKEPEKYRDLKIRVGGWEAYFVDLPRAQQEFQIQKCEQYA